MTHANFEIITILSSRTNIYDPTIYFFLFSEEEKKETTSIVAGIYAKFITRTRKE